MHTKYHSFSNVLRQYLSPPPESVPNPADVHMVMGLLAMHSEGKHKVHAKLNAVTLIVDEEEESVVSVECPDCVASKGSCKHTVAFLMWTHRRSEEPPCTAVACYWKKSKLSRLGTSLKVPRTTLRNKIRGNIPETTGRVGPESVLGRSIEDKLEEWLLGTSRMGFPINKDFLIHSVKRLVEAEGLKNPFTNNVPGRKWFDGFLKRHPRVGQKRA
ncbi:hypothetical protein EVAR_102057_1 [Eumeta japonica]|uniref:HTH CENPB-type domain-containing protein n=1 Tax=Eumeta variegata TaxID=151549 RepID=A0A4C1TZN7_EUMVA|nr:hypothetical protein EVAR_102057_1 [Eumeta japonica]